MKHLESYVVVIETDDAADFEQAYDWLDSALDKVQHIEDVEATQHTMSVDASAAPGLLAALIDLVQQVTDDEAGTRLDTWQARDAIALAGGEV